MLKKIVFPVLLFMLVAGVADASLFKNKFEKEVTTEAVAVKLARETLRGGYKLVTAAELKSWIDQGKSMLIIDTMPYDASYKKGHVPGAKQFLFPIPEMKTWDSSQTAGKSLEDYKALLGKDKNRIIVIYCGFVKCGRSHNGAAWAVKLGYKNVYRFAGGIYAWKGADYPVEKAK